MAGGTAHIVNDNEGSIGASHKRNKSGGFLGAFSFLKSSKDIEKDAETEALEQAGAMEHVEGIKKDSSIATALRQSHGRQRKGSLRQAAMAKMRERSGSLRKDRAALQPPIITTMDADSPEDGLTPRQPHYGIATPNSSSESERSPVTRWPDHAFLTEAENLQHLLAPVGRPVGSYASTTDEDDSVSFYRLSTASGTSSFNIPSQGSTVSLARRRSNRSERRASFTTAPPTPEIDLDEAWDYSETEWWGWVVLIATWIVFVVGMGSCLGVWSWAWDVGETPYAPPDLEDDDTLPITGYYPALMVCTAVMAWVWVVVAWVGMKYFRHAKVGVDG